MIIEQKKATGSWYINKKSSDRIEEQPEKKRQQLLFEVLFSARIIASWCDSHFVCVYDKN